MKKLLARITGNTKLLGLTVALALAIVGTGAGVVYALNTITTGYQVNSFQTKGVSYYTAAGTQACKNVRNNNATVGVFVPTKTAAEWTAFAAAAPGKNIAITDTSWTPDPSTRCTTQQLVQSDTCNNTRTVWGTDPCYTYSWIYSGTGACSVSCGGGTQWVDYYCRRSDGTSVADSYCAGASGSTGYSESCNTQACCTPDYTNVCGTGSNANKIYSKNSCTNALTYTGTTCDHGCTSGSCNVEYTTSIYEANVYERFQCSGGGYILINGTMWDSVSCPTNWSKTINIITDTGNNPHACTGTTKESCTSGSTGLCSDPQFYDKNYYKYTITCTPPS